MRHKGKYHELKRDIWIKGFHFKISFLFWRSWKKNSSDKFLVKIEVADEIKCCCFDTNSHETI